MRGLELGQEKIIRCVVAEVCIPQSSPALQKLESGRITRV